MFDPLMQENLGGIQPVVPPQPLPQQPLAPAEAPFAGVVNPMPGLAGPPKDDAEFQQRKAGWSDFFSQLRDDPRMQQGLIYSMQTILRGGNFADALAVGTAAYNMVQQNQEAALRTSAEEQRKQAEHEANVKLTESRIDESGARTAESKFDLEQKRRMADTVMAEAQRKLEAAKTEAESRAVELATKKKLQDLGMDVKEVEARVTASKAQAASAFASARNSSASAAKTEQETKIIGSLTSDEQKALAVGKGSKGGMTEVQQQEWEVKKVKAKQVVDSWNTFAASNPKGDILQWEMQSGLKAKDLADARAIMAYAAKGTMPPDGGAAVTKRVKWNDAVSGN